MNNQQYETLTGSVERVVFCNQENGFVIFKIQHRGNDIITAKGYIPTLKDGQDVILRGSWDFHPKFGKQFIVDNCTQQVPTSIIGLKKYLASGMIKGIGPVYAEKLVKKFGEKVLDIIEHTPEKLQLVEGIGPGRAKKITTAWQEQKEISHIMVFLQDKGISPVYAAKIYKTYGNDAINIILENPYKLAEDIWGVGFKTADQVAQNIGIAPQSVKRITAGILHVIAQNTNNGHLYCELESLKTAVYEVLELEKDKISSIIKTAFHDLYEREKIKLISKDSIHYITLSQFYFSEKNIAQKLETLLKYSSRCSFDIQKIYQELRTQTGPIQLHEKQQEGIITALQKKVAVITGGPGTGKTTLIKKLITILDQNKVTYKLTAPTGRAAKRMTESTSKPATTIHRLLEFDPSTMRFTKNEQSALALDFLIIDEASMIDVFLANSILKSLPEHAHLILIGDIDQLPSVGAGNVLGDIIASKKIPCIRLQTIFRQSQDSMIIINAHRINNGDFPTTRIENAKRDFIFIKEDDPANVMHHITDIYKKALPRFKISTNNMMILSPMHRGAAGTQNINHYVQQLLNGDTNKPSISFGGATYRIDDRIMQLRNNYDKKVFNGDTGIIQEINHEDKEISINFEGKLITYLLSELHEITLAYAISIHKSQGSEYQAVIVPVFTQHYMLLQRNLLYTAITRAKKLCIFIGQTRAIAMAITNNKGNERITFLTDYLTSNLSAR